MASISIDALVVGSERLFDRGVMTEAEFRLRLQLLRQSKLRRARPWSPASSLVWRFDDIDGSFALIPGSFYPDGTRGPHLGQDAVDWISVLHGIAALSAVVYTVGVALGLPPY